MEIRTYCINLNIYYTAPNEIWSKLGELYTKMPGWNGKMCEWYGYDGKLIYVSVEPSGLQFCAQLPVKEWEAWISEFKKKATEIMGYEIGEPEDGFEFRYYE